MVDTVKRDPGNEGGGLGDDLVEAALDRLRHSPADGMSMRGLASDLGVSHQAPYVHFGSRRRFLAAVAGTGLARAADRAVAAVEAAGDDPRRRLHALVDAYLSFISTEPHLHDLAYGPTVAKADHELLQQAAIRYWNVLHDTVAACQPPGTAEDDVLRRATTTWGTVYGVARLAAFRQIPDSVPSDGDTLVHEALDMLIDGWNATAKGRPPRRRA